MNILYITKNVVEYKAAMYQNEFLQELHRQENVVIYGPGEELFDSCLDINQVVSKLNFKNNSYREIKSHIGHTENPRLIGKWSAYFIRCNPPKN